MHSRKLVPIEQAMEVLNRTAGSYNVVTISRVKGCLNQELVEQALKIIHQRHPLLQGCIVGSLNDLQFTKAKASKIPLRIEESNDGDYWREVVLSELNQGIQSDQGLIRVALVRQSDTSISYLITTIHHAIVDALSSLALHTEILTYCHRIMAGETIVLPPSLPALTTVHDLLPKKHQGLSGKIRSILFVLNLKFKILRHQARSLDFEKYVPIASRRCGVVYRQFSPDMTTTLLHLCRQEKTTVQGALCAAMLLTVAQQVRSGKDDKIPVTCRSYVNLRQRLSPHIEPEHLGVLASAITSFHTLDRQTCFWSLARDVKHQLEKGLKQGDMFSAVLMSRKIIESLLAQPGTASVTVGLTNVGQVDLPGTYGSLELEEISFIPAQAAFGGVFAAAVTTFQGKMLLNFMFSEPSISYKAMESLADSAIACITQLCQASSYQ